MELTSIPAGNLCWTDLGTTDPEAAKRFYSAIFGWTYKDIPMGEQGNYSMALAAGKQVGALSGGVGDCPPHWTTYFCVDNADASVAKAKELGGSVLTGPFDEFDAGRMAIVQDPTSAAFAIWQPGNHHGFERFGESGAVVWTELNTNDVGKAGSFYASFLGWGIKKTEGPMDYTEFQNGGRSIAGMMTIQPEWGDVPPHWLVYFGCDDVDVAVAKTSELGGRTLTGPMDIPNMGRFAILMDPQGAVFAVYK